MDISSTSLYISEELPTNKFPNKHLLRKSVWETIQSKLGNEYVYDEDKQEIVFEIENKKVRISYRIREVPEDRIILVYFYPRGNRREFSEPSRWNKKFNVKAAIKTLEVCDVLGDFEVRVRDYPSLIRFQRIGFDNENNINISKWLLSFYHDPQIRDTKRVKEFFDSRNRYREIEDIIIPRFIQSPEFRSTFVIFYDPQETTSESHNAITLIKKLLERFGHVEGPYSMIQCRELIEKRPDKDGIVIFFIASKSKIKSAYKNLKIYFDTKGIPTQFIFVETILDKVIKYPGVRANFLLEIATKAARKEKPIQLEPPLGYAEGIGGILCISDVKDAKRLGVEKLFGALFINIKGLHGERVHIYNDIKYEVDENDDLLKISKDDALLLSEKAGTLIGVPSKIDILLTREWKRDSLHALINGLQENHNIQVKNVYYVSTKVARFIDEYTLNNPVKEFNIHYKIHPDHRPWISSYSHPFIRIGSKSAIIKPATMLRIYPTLFGVYVRLVWPYNKKLKREDLFKILWLIKKRTYRVQEFFTLKVPEPVTIFRNIRKMYLGKIEGTVEIPLNLMI